MSLGDQLIKVVKVGNVFGRGDKENSVDPSFTMTFYNNDHHRFFTEVYLTCRKHTKFGHENNRRGTCFACLHVITIIWEE